MDPACALVLVALSDEYAYTGRWSLDASERLQLFEKIEAAGGRWAGDGRLTLDEFRRFLHNETTAAEVDLFPASVHGLLNEDMVAEAFKSFDHDGSGFLDAREWDDFIQTLSAMHLKYLMKVAFQQWRTFWGRDQPWRPPGHEQALVEMAKPSVLRRILEKAAGSSLVPLASTPRQEDLQMLPGSCLNQEGFGVRRWNTFQLGRDPDCVGSSWLPPGWSSDFCYYSANNHPLHGIFACDPKHRLSRLERIGMEFATFGLAITTSRLERIWVQEGQAPLQVLSNPRVFSLVVVTLPGLLLWHTLWFLFTCPRCNVDKARSSVAVIKRAKRWKWAGAFLGHSLLWLGFASIVAWRMRHSQEGGWNRPELLAARLQGYLVTWVCMLVFYLNPFVAWGQPDPKGKPVAGEIIGLGQWRIEKQRFQLRCVETLDKLVTSQTSILRDVLGGSLGSAIANSSWRDAASRILGGGAKVLAAPAVAGAAAASSMRSASHMGTMGSAGHMASVASAGPMASMSSQVGAPAGSYGGLQSEDHARSVRMAHDEGAAEKGASKGLLGYLDSIFFEPDTAVSTDKMNFVGSGQGPYEKAAAYEFVGDGSGAYLREEVADYGPDWRLQALALLLLIAVSIIGSITWGPKLSAAVSGAPEAPAGAGVTPLPGLAATTKVTTSGPFDCGSSDRGSWSSVKASWCCEAEGVECRNGMRPGMVGGLETTSSTPMQLFSCSGSPDSWLAVEKAWCCSQHHLGCLQPTSTRAPATTSTTKPPPDCHSGSSDLWAVEKQDYCCVHFHMACPPPPFPMPVLLRTPSPDASTTTACPYDCDVGFTGWTHEWSIAKQDYCCREVGRGCKP